jgi:hypothetical protein
MRMIRRTICAGVALVPLLVWQATAQAPGTPAAPKTKLEAFEAQDGVAIIQGFSKIGELRGAFGGSVAVQAKEFTNATTGTRVSGISIDVNEGGRVERHNRSFIDYDEIASLLKGIDYIAKADRSVTKLENFQVDYRTRGDVKVSTFNTSGGELMVAVSSGRIGSTSVHLRFADLAVLRNLISSARDRLDAVKQQ